MTDTRDPAGPRDVDVPRDALAAFAELARINLGSTDLDQVLARVATLAKSVLHGVLEASVTLVVEGSPRTATFTGWTASDLDERQYALGDGPCLSAATHRATHLIEDTAKEQRWPTLMTSAHDLGVRSILSVGLPVHDVVAGAINLYAGRLGVFDDDAVTLAETFANYAAVALANAYLYSAKAALAEQMATAMESRAVIEQAKGILMARQNIDADEAFALLSRASQTSNRKLREIAAGIVSGTTRPDGDGHRQS